MTKKQLSKKHNSKAKLNIFAVVSVVLSLIQALLYSVIIFYGTTEISGSDNGYENLVYIPLYLLFGLINTVFFVFAFRSSKSKNRYNEFQIAVWLYTLVIVGFFLFFIIKPK